MSEANGLKRLSEAHKHATTTINSDNVHFSLSVEERGIRIGLFYDFEGEAADAGKLVSFDDIEEAAVNPLIVAIDAALAFVGAEVTK